MSIPPNPYASPQTDSTGLPTPSKNRGVAQHHLRLALLILLAPAAYNFICFSFPAEAGAAGLHIPAIYRWINGFGFVVTAAAIWFFGLPLLELLTLGLHRIFGRTSSALAWKEALYQVLGRAPFFAVAGAFLWALWVAAFYQFGVGFYAVSVPIGIAAHLLAAGLYVPLIACWYNLRRSSSSPLER
ncbi:MAG: hypothetical protein ACR2OA_21095 [Rubripirellula sp.]